MGRRKEPVAAIEESIGKRITALRKRQGLTQVDLADRLAMSQSLLSRYERGRLRLHGALLIEFSKALGVSADELLGLREPKGVTASADRRFVRRLQQIGRLSKRRQQALLMTIDAFLKQDSNSAA